MKKIFLKSLSVILAICLLSLQSFNGYAIGNSSAVNEIDESVFSFDEELLNDEISELNELDAYLEQNEDVTFEMLVNEESPLIENIASTASPMGMAAGQAGEPPLGIPSFLWGCVLGVVGLAVVYIMTEQDMDETKKALWGCVASTAVSVVLYLVIWGAWATTAVRTNPYYY